MPVLETVGIPNGAAVLDVGFRRATRLLEIRSIVGENGAVYGVEVDRTALKEAVQQLKEAKRVFLLAGDATNLPLAAGMADVVLFRGVLHEIQDVREALREARRVCRHGGFVMVMDFAAFPYRWHLLSNLRWRLRHRTVFGAPRDKHPGFKRTTLQQLLADAGFTVVDYRPNVGFSRHTGHDVPIFMVKALSGRQR